MAHLLLPVAYADSFEEQSRSWPLHAAERGVTYARVVVEYGLSDDCELARIRVLENSAHEILDDDAIRAIVAFFIGPFQGKQRTVYWPTNLGHQYIRCEFDVSGTLARASLAHTRNNLSGRAAERQIDLRLSTLGTKTRTVNFSFRNGSLTWTATDG